jgi:hypothetical protein
VTTLEDSLDIPISESLKNTLQQFHFTKLRTIYPN